ncbi:metal-dependent hydrolase [Coralliovum pocilloporae]|uniref:metal-dependent hydrolase n=1 Tax=Coralliovum pocilloporae TaxID=3066369 RepID=UPI0033070535
MHHSEHEILPRDLRFGLSDNPVRNWFAGDPIKTAMMNSMSIFLPEGERFFIRSLKHYAKKTDNAELISHIDGYARQEAFHTREHEDYNESLRRLGYDVNRMEAPIRQALRMKHKPVYDVALTCAIEHMTATLSIATLRNTKLLEGAEPAYRRLWMWHALEELEHAGVALEVFEKATSKVSPWKRYLLRTATMNATLIVFVVTFIRNMRLMLKADGESTGLSFWAKLFWVSFVSPGYTRLGFIHLARYYSPWFHPSSETIDALIVKGRAWLEEELAPDQSGALPAPAE